MRIRRILRVLVVAAGIVAVLLIAATALLHSRTAKRLAFGEVQKFLARQDISIDAADFDYSFSPLRISTGRITIRRISTPDLPEFFSADQFIASAKFSDLYYGRYRIEDVEMNNPAIHIVFDERQRGNFPGTSDRATNSNKPIDLLILKLRSTSGSFTYEDRSKNILVRSPLWDLTMDGNSANDSQEFHFKARESSEARFNERRAAIDSVELHGTLKNRNRSLDLRRATMSSELGSLTLSGTIENLKDPNLNLSAISDVHLKPVQQLFSIKENIQGDLHLEALLTGQPKHLQLKGRLNGRNLAVNRFREIVMESDLAVDLGAGRVRLSSVLARSPIILASGSADVSFAADSGDGNRESNIAARYDIPDLQRLLRLYGVPVSVASRVVGNVRLNWPGVDIQRLGANGSAQLYTKSVASARDIPVSGQVGFTARGNRLTATIHHLDSGALHLSGLVNTQSQKQVGGTLRLEVSDTGEALKQVAGWVEGSVPANLQLSGPAVIDAKLAGTFEKPRIDASVDANKLRLNSLENIHLTGNAEYTPNQIDIPGFSVSWQSESMTGSGRIGLTAAGPVDGQFSVSNASIHRVLTTLGRPEIPAEGAADVAATVSGTTKNPIITAKISASNLKAYGEPLGTLSADARLENQVVILDTLTLNKSGGGMLQASGRYEIAPESYSFDLTGSDLQLNRLLLPNGTAIHGNVSLNAQGRGTLENPSAVIKLTARDVQVDSEDLRSIDMDINLVDRRAHIVAAAPFYGVKAVASLGIVRPYPAEIELRVDGWDISRFPGEKLKDLAGQVTAVVNATGNLSDIESAVALADVPSLRLNWRNHDITNDKPIRLGYRNRELTVVQADIRLDQSTAQFSGTVPLEGSVGQLKVEGRANLADLAKLVTLNDPVLAEGQLLVTGSLRGNLKRIDPDLTITLTDGSVKSAAMIAPLTEANLIAVARDGRVVLERLTGRWGDAKVSAVGEATLAVLPDLPFEIPRPDSPVRLSVDVEKFMLSSMTRPPLNTDGTISLKIEAEAEKRDISTVQLRVTFPDLKFMAGTFALDQVGVSRIEIRDGIASVRQFHLRGPKTDIQLSGTADLRKSGPVDVQLKGDTDAAVLSLFSRTVKGTGAARLNVDVTGTVREPKVNGYVEITDGQARIDYPRIGAENIQARIDLNGARIDLTRLDATLNGGTVKGEGQYTLSGAHKGETKLEISGDGVYMEFPAGLKTVSNVRFRLDGTYPELVLSGNIDVEEGAYTEPLTVGRGLMRFLSSEQKSFASADTSVNLQGTRLDVSLRTLSPIEVNNNIAQGEIDAELRLLGTIEEPGLTGKIEVDEGATLYLRERKYSVDRGLITFNNEHTIQPVLDVAATTTVKTNGSSDYDITMKISGDVSRKLETDLTSSPPLSEGDIVSVLATGRTLNEASSAGGDVAKEQILSFIAGDLGSSFTSQAGRAIGLSQVRIDPSYLGTSKSDSTSNTTSDPNLVSQEAEPTARLTLGKDITPDLSLVYSMNLRDSSDQIWIAEYDITRRLTTSGIRQSDNTFRFQVQHDLLLGLPGVAAKIASPARRKIGAVHFSGDSQLTMEKLSSTAGLKSGKSYDFFSVQNARERLEKVLSTDDRLEARISVERKTTGTTVDLVFHIQEGPRVRIIYEGWDISNDLKDEIRKAWSQGVIDSQRIADVVDIIERELVKEKYYGFQIGGVMEMPNEDAKTVRFTIQPGSRYDIQRVVFEGVQSIRESELQALLKAAGYLNQGPRERALAAPSLASLYRERGFIDVKVDAPSSKLDENSRTLTTEFRITEGGLYHFGNIRFQGNAEFTGESLLTKIKIGPEDVFQHVTLNKARQILQELYRGTGYSDATVQISQIKEVSRKAINVVFTIQEGRQRIVQEIQVDGNEKTSKGLVRSQMAMEPGDILSDEKLSQARTNLYDAGAFAFVDFDVTAMEPSPGLKANQVPVRLVTRVREVQPWELKYGGYWDTERGPGLVTDLSNRNMLGNARVLGIQLRYDADLTEGRMYFSQPVLRRFPIKSLLSAFKSREEKTDDTTLRTTITDKEGLSPTLEYKFRKYNTISLGYRLEKTRQYTAVPDPTFPPALARTAPVTASFSRDTRDDPFDASKGHFTSHAVDWGTHTLGSDLHYLKYFGQFFDYTALGNPTVVPWTKEVRNRLLLAYGARVGILKGEPLQDFRTEQFKSGGGTTVRGFEQDRLGPLDASGNPTGGDAELILNTELRFPLYKFFDGVAFVDAGNVYPKLQDFSPFDVRGSVGFGIRIRTPYLLLRLDYGIKMNPKPGESKGQFFFTFGQAF